MVLVSIFSTNAHLLHHLRAKLSSIPSLHLKDYLPNLSSTAPVTHRRAPTNPSNFSYTLQWCARNQDLDFGIQAHARMITSGFTPTVFVYNCLLNFYVRCSSLVEARKVFDGMRERDSVSWNVMIAGFIQSGSMDMARSLFESMEGPDVVSWNSVISGYLRNGEWFESVVVFTEMRQCGVRPDQTTFAVVLKSCSSLQNYEVGVQVHGLVAKLNFNSDLMTGSALVDMYAKCKKLDESLIFFDRMPERNQVSWSALIAGCVQNEKYLIALEVLVKMVRDGFVINQSAYASGFRSCSALIAVRMGWQLHGHSIKSFLDSDVIVGTAILDMYTKCDSLDSAKRVFNGLTSRSLQTWNAIIVGFSRNNRGTTAIELFRTMYGTSVGVDAISLSAFFSACAQVKGYLLGSQAHSLAIKTGLILDVCVKNSVLDMYGKCGALYEVRVTFEDMELKDAVSWNALIAALEQNGLYHETLVHFGDMLHHGMNPDEFTYGGVLKACACLKRLDFGKKIHDLVIKCGLGFQSFISSALIDMYCKCGAIEEAVKLHGGLDEPTVVSWNAIISGFSLEKNSEEAQKFFFIMLEAGLKPDNFTYATILDTCANLAIVSLGKQVHAQIIKEKILKDVYVISTLVDMYAKCGNTQDALLVFEKSAERDFVSWNAVICGYSYHGFGEEALKMFERMQQENVAPNLATFVAILRACAHVGHVDEGERYFRLMSSKYGLIPQLEHYSCMVDLIGRTRGIGEALKLIEGMPYEADAVLWRAVLSICKMHGNVELAELAASKILSLDPEDSAAYVLLANVYSKADRWRDVLKIRVMMKHNRLKKEPGCSWIEIKNEMHTFLIADKAHPLREEIYKRLDELIGEMMWTGYVPAMDLFLDAEEYR